MDEGNCVTPKELRKTQNFIEADCEAAKQARQRLLRNSMEYRDGGKDFAPAAKRRHVKARHGSAGRRKWEKASPL